MQGGVRPLVPQEPLFSPAALRFSGGSQVSKGALSFNFFWARNAIFYGLHAFGIRPGQKILVPAYLCTAAIQPIEYFGAKVEFYEIRRSCEPDWSDLESKIRGDVRAILAVHYFGFACEIERYRALCDRHDLLLIEDCAHVLEGAPNPYRLGEVGDFSVFSPRKHLPVFDGGRLRLNRPTQAFQVRFQSESPLFTLRVAKNLVERRKPPIVLLTPPSPLELQPAAGRSKSESGPAQSRPEKPRYVFPNDTSFLPWMADFPMSRLSKHLLPHFPVQNIAAKRRANYDGLLKRILKLERVQPLFEQLAPGVVPWVLPVTVGERSDAHTQLRALGIPAVTWGGVRDPRISRMEFPEADFLYDCLVFLPIHQDLDTAHLDLIADAIAKVCQMGNR